MRRGRKRRDLLRQKDRFQHHAQQRHQSRRHQKLPLPFQKDGKRKKVPKFGKAIDPNLYLRKYLVCPVCGHSLTGSTSGGNGGKYTYYHCCNDGKHLRKRAEEVNESFANYIDGLKPNEVVMNLYREILRDLRGEQGRERLKEAEALRK